MRGAPIPTAREDDMIRKDLIASRRAVARFHVRLAAFYLVGLFVFLITGSLVSADWDRGSPHGEAPP